MAKNGKLKLQKLTSEVNHPAVVCEQLIGQAEAFTAPRGRLEMGGLLLGHIDQEGNNVAVCGFFPEQTQESPGYCEFGGMYNAIAAAACAHANESIKGKNIPKLRIIGWIHTHPDIGIFLSSIDVATYKMLRDQCPNRRFMAVVVDPLRQEHGVFLTERKEQTYEAANGYLRLEATLEARYHVLLDRLRTIQHERGLKFLPCILPGYLRGKRNAMGDRDDIENEMRKGHFLNVKKSLDVRSKLDTKLSKNEKKINSLEQQISTINNTNRELKNQLTQKNKQINSMGMEMSRVKQDIVTLKGTNIDLEKKFAESEKIRVDSNISQHRDIENIKNDFQKLVDSIKKKVYSMDKEREDLIVDITRIKNIVRNERIRRQSIERQSKRM
jgi:proteasome lid subunit RPN8/RPN11